MGKANVFYERGKENWERGRVTPGEFQSTVRQLWASSLDQKLSWRRVIDEIYYSSCISAEQGKVPVY